MTNEEAIEHVKALIQFCKEDMGVCCGKCPFGKPSLWDKDRTFCRLTETMMTSHVDGELEEENEETQVHRL